MIASDKVASGALYSRTLPLDADADGSVFAHHLSEKLSKAIIFVLPYSLAAKLDPRISAWRAFVAITSGVAALPLILAVSTGYRGLELLWLAEWGLVDALLLVLSLDVAQRAIAVSDDITRMVGFDHCAQPWWRPWSDRWMPRSRQLASFGAGLVGAALTDIPVAEALQSRLDLGVISYVQLAFTGALGASVAYFGAAALDLCRELVHLNNCHRFKIRWWAPARTVSIERLSSLYRIGFAWTFIGALLFSPPVVWAYLTGHKSVIFLIAVLVALMGTFLIVLGIGWLPHYWLSQIIHKEKRKIIDKLASRVEMLPPLDDDAGWSTGTGIPQLPLVAIAMAMEGLDDVTYDLRYILRVTTAVALSILPYVISLIIRV